MEATKRKGNRPHAMPDDAQELAKIVGNTELPALAAPEIVFCRGLLQGMNALEAYVLAYPAHRAWKRGSLLVAASRLRCSERVKANLGAMMESGMMEFLPTVGQHVGQLVRIRERSIVSGQLTAAVTAEVQIGKAGRVYDFEHRDSEQIDVSDDDLLRAIAEIDPQQARKARQALPAPHAEPRRSVAIVGQSDPIPPRSSGTPAKSTPNK